MNKFNFGGDRAQSARLDFWDCNTCILYRCLDVRWHWSSDGVIITFAKQQNVRLFC